MKLDDDYTSINVCPVTEEQMTHNDIHRTNGVCPHCGHSGYLLSHHNVVVGRYRRPSFWEWIRYNAKVEFVSKDEEDKIMKALNGGYEA